MFGGTLNATTATAQEATEVQAERESGANQMSLSHDSEQPELSQSVVETTIPTQAQAAEDAVSAARQAVEDAANELPFDPANKPLQSLGAQSLPDQTVVHPVDTNVLDRQSGTLPMAPPEIAQPGQTAPQMQSTPVPTSQSQVPTPPQSASMPPLPPLPSFPTDGSAPPLPPMPPLPGQSSNPVAGFQPQVNPQFMESVNQSQNPLTEAGQTIAAEQAQKDAARQQKIDELGTQYDVAADKNREVQGQPPVNNDHTTFPLPPQL